MWEIYFIKTNSIDFEFLKNFKQESLNKKERVKHWLKLDEVKGLLKQKDGQLKPTHNNLLTLIIS